MSSGYKIEPLGKENYDTWSLQAQAVLIKNELWEYVSGQNIKPETDSAAIAKYQKQDLLARSELLLLISPSELKQVKTCKTSKETWDKLKSIYQSEGPARKATLLKQLILKKMSEKEDIRDHLNNFIDIVDKLANMGVQINSELLSIIMLYSLPSSFENFRIAIESRDQLPKPEDLKVKIIEESDARSSKNQDKEEEAMYGRNKYINKKAQYEKNKQSKDIECYRCHKRGHIAIDCRSKPRGGKPKNFYAEELCFNNRKYNGAKTSSWCLDSGCTSHMSFDKEIFSNIEENKNCSALKLASNNCTAQVDGKGVATLRTKETPTLRLFNTLFVPSLTTNLMSVGKITDKGATVLFKRNCATVKDKGELIMKAFKKEDGLYYIHEDKPEKCKYSCLNEIDKWHRKLGHLNETQLKIALNKESMNGLIFNKNEKLNNCEICMEGKMTKLPFAKCEPQRTNEVLEIIHTDVCGPMKVPTIAGSKYFITFTDDFSKYCRIYTMKHKDEAFDFFKQFKTEVERFTDKKIKSLQSDNGSEYVNKGFDEFLKKSGIKRRLSAPYTPEQNGVAERKNRTLLDKARCMLIEANLPERFWGEAIQTANYITNRCPCSTIGNITPFEKWLNRKPSVRHLKIFGNKAFILNKWQKKSKFKPKSSVGIFVGYSEYSKAYRLFIPQENKVIISRDVKIIDKMYYQDDSKSDAEEQETTENQVEIIFKKKNCNLTEEMEKESTEMLKLPTENEIITENEISMNDIQNEHEIGCEDIQGESIPQESPLNEIKRKRTLPKWHNDYVMNCVEDAIFYCEEENIDINEPEWQDAIKDEIISHLKNDTWKIVHRNKNQHIIDSKMILKNKYTATGEIKRRKGRLVARGFNQKEGIDYKETFSPVSKLSTIRFLISYAVANGLKLYQLDICTAFLNGDIEEDIFMFKPHNLEKYLNRIVNEECDFNIKKRAESMLREIKNSKSETVCKLNKAIYGLKQAGRQWYIKLHNKLNDIGFKSSLADPCLYILEKGENKIIINLYVDDLIIAYNTETILKEVKEELEQPFEIRDMGKLNYCLGIHFTHVGGEVTIDQQQYIENILSKFKMHECNSVSTPIQLNIKLKKSENKEELKKYPYQNLIGSLMYLAIATRPDILYTVSYLSQFNSCYDESHWLALKRVLRYLKETKTIKLKYAPDKTLLIGMADADWAACKVDRRSYTGFIFKYAGGLVSFESRKQRTVALSTAEAEYMALTDCAKEAIHLLQLLRDVGVQQSTTTIYSDNIAAQKLANNPLVSNRSKHIDIKEHFIRDCIKDKKIEIKYKDSKNMEADILTKAVPQPRLTFLMKRLGLESV